MYVWLLRFSEGKMVFGRKLLLLLSSIFSFQKKDNNEKSKTGRKKISVLFDTKELHQLWMQDTPSVLFIQTVRKRLLRLSYAVQHRSKGRN